VYVTSFWLAYITEGQYVGKEPLVAKFKVLPHHFPGGIQENHVKLKSEYSVFGPRFERGTARASSRSGNHSATTLFGYNSKEFIRQLNNYEALKKYTRNWCIVNISRRITSSKPRIRRGTRKQGWHFSTGLAIFLLSYLYFDYSKFVWRYISWPKAKTSRVFYGMQYTVVHTLFHRQWDVAIIIRKLET
jgi:hypothetical protein